MIHVEALYYTYPPALPGGERVTALDSVSFDVPMGTCLAVTGSNGCGKTTLCLAVAGLAPRLTGGRMSGLVTVGEQDVQARPPGTLANVIGLVLQDPTGQLFNPTVEEEIAWGLENLGVPPNEMQARIDRALEVVGLDGIPRDQPPQTLSGGQQKRLALAAALALLPQVLILDEPAGGLAPTARMEMITVLRGLRASRSLTVLLTENDPDVIVALADEVLLLEAGHVVKQGNPESIYPALDSNMLPGVAVPPAGRFASTVNIGEDIHLTCLTLDQAVEQTLRYPLNGASSGPAHPQEVPTPGILSQEAAVEFEDLAFAYQPDRPVLRGIDLTIPRGQFVTLTGDNGAGKTTLTKHLIGLLRPMGGRVRLLGADVAGQSIGQLARQVGFVFQNPELQIFNATVREEIAFGPQNLGMNGPALEEAVEGTLRLFDLQNIADHPPAVLSFSARRMVALASIAAMSTPVLILDEPTVGLDAEGQVRVMAWLEARHGEGTTIILITHDMELAAAHAERVIVLNGGCIVADGPPHRVFAQAGALEQAGLQPPFALQFAEAMGHPALAADLTPPGAARVWMECIR